MRDLLQDDQQADAREHPLDHGGREEVSEDARAGDAEEQLEDARQDDGDQEGLVAAEGVDRLEDDHRQSGRRARDTQGRPAERADEDAADDSGDQAGEERGTGGQGDAEAERHGHEEDDDSGGDVLSKAR